jgi:hypothetical protein
MKKAPGSRQFSKHGYYNRVNTHTQLSMPTTVLF